MTTTTVTRATKNQKISLTFNGETKSLREWAVITGKPYHTLYSRFKANPTAEHVFKDYVATQAEAVAESQAAV